MSDDFEKNSLTRVRRLPERGRYDKQLVYDIVDEALICHIAFVEGDQPILIPTIHARIGDVIVFHGAKASRLLKHVQAGHRICAAMTLLDGLVLARSVFNHSMNYRSAVLFGTGRLLEDEDEKMRALVAITEHVARGRWDDARGPNRQELDATSVVEMTIADASAKVRTGPPKDDEEDLDLPIWAGVLPLTLAPLPPIDDPKLRVAVSAPDYVTKYGRG